MSTIDIHSLKLLIGKRIKELREGNGYSVRKLALLAEMEHQQILAVEKGDTDFRLSTLVKLSNALEVPPNELLLDFESEK